MSQIERRWIADGAVDASKLDPNDSYSVRGLFVDSSNALGSIAMGTLDPKAAIHVRRTADVAGDRAAILLDLDDGASGKSYEIFSDSNGCLKISDTTQSCFIIDSSRKTGFNTDFPLDPLHVRADATSVESALRLETDNSSGLTYRLVSDVDGNFKIQDIDHGQDRFIIESAGTINIPGDCTVVGNFHARGTVSVINTETIVSTELQINQATDNTALHVHKTDLGTAVAVLIENAGTGPSLVANRKVRIEDSTTTGLEIITPISNAWISHVFHRNTYSYILLGNDDGDSLPYGEIRAEKDTQSSFILDALNGRILRLGCDGTTFVGISGGVTPIVNIENSAVLFCQDATVLTVDIQNDLRVQNRIIALDNDTGVRIENDTTTCGLTLKSPMSTTGIYTHITMGDYDPGSGALPVGHIITRTPHPSVDPYIEIQADLGAVILTSMNVQMVKVNSGSVIIEGDSTINGAISVGGDVLPDSDYAYRSGVAGSGWALVYSDIVAMNYLYAATEGIVRSSTDIIPSLDNAYNLGADTTDWASVHTRYIQSNNVLDIQGENAMVIRSQTAGITLQGNPISVERYLGVVDFRIINPPTVYPGGVGEQWRVWCDTADGNRLKLRTLLLP